MTRCPRPQAGLAAAVTLLALAALATGCSGKLKVRTTHDSDARFDGLRTYAWMVADESSPRDPRLANREIDSRIRSVVDAEMERRGYVKTDEESDFLLKYHAVLEGGLDSTVLDSSYGVGPGWSYDRSWVWSTGMRGSYVPKYRKGALVLDVIQPDDEVLIWRSSAQAKVHVDANPEDRRRRLAVAVQRMLDDFPPETD